MSHSGDHVAATTARAQNAEFNTTAVAPERWRACGIPRYVCGGCNVHPEICINRMYYIPRYGHNGCETSRVGVYLFRSVGSWLLFSPLPAFLFLFLSLPHSLSLALFAPSDNGRRQGSVDRPASYRLPPTTATCRRCPNYRLCVMSKKLKKGRLLSLSFGLSLSLATAYPFFSYPAALF